ncbi:MAG: cytochrome o ubiquinol oxidase subunit IV [Pseudomonadota bacterium]
MSNEAESAPVGSPDPAHGGDHAGHATYRAYLTGFALSVVLTIIPFWMVLGQPTDNVYIALTVIFSLGAAQIMVHVYYFLHVNLKAEQGWQAMSLGFTFMLVVIVLAGSIWVMFHLNENMMPAHEQIERVRNLP